MPIHPIGEENRKGTLGSPYSVKDYYGVNPEFGSLEDLKAFVDEAHALGMYVILDWVANHTAWDNPLRTEHPDWYERDWDGDFRPTPWWDWSDIIDLDYLQAEVREYMTEAMKYWVRDVGIDGYRCDVAGFVPVQFWNNVRRELDAIKPVLMLAEWGSRDRAIRCRRRPADDLQRPGGRQSEAPGVLRERPHRVAPAPDRRPVPETVRAEARQHGSVERAVGCDACGTRGRKTC